MAGWGDDDEEVIDAPARARASGALGAGDELVSGGWGDDEEVVEGPAQSAGTKDNQARAEFARTDPRRTDMAARKGTMRRGASPFVADGAADSSLFNPGQPPSNKAVAEALDKPAPDYLDMDERSPERRAADQSVAVGDAKRRRFFERSGELLPASERGAVRQLVDASVRKPLDGSLAGLAVESAGDVVRGTKRGADTFVGSVYSLADAALSSAGLGNSTAADVARAAGKAARQGANQWGNPTDTDSITQAVFESAVSNVALMLPLGFGNKTLAGMWATTFGGDYGESRDHGLTHDDAVGRAAYMATAEVIGEKFALKSLGKVFAQAAQGVSTKEMGHLLSDMLVKEQIGEQVTTAMQAAYEKWGDKGRKPGMTLDDYLKDVVKTAQVALGQSLLMGGAAGIVRALSQTREQQIAAATNDNVAGTFFKANATDSYARHAGSADANTPGMTRAEWTARQQGDVGPAAPVTLRMEDMPDTPFTPQDVTHLQAAADQVHAEEFAARGIEAPVAGEAAPPVSAAGVEAPATRSEQSAETIAPPRPTAGATAADPSVVGIARVPQGAIAVKAEQGLRQNAQEASDARVPDAPGGLAGRGGDERGGFVERGLAGAGPAPVGARGDGVNAALTQRGDGAPVPAGGASAQPIGALNEATRTNEQATPNQAAIANAAIANPQADVRDVRALDAGPAGPAGAPTSRPADDAKRIDAFRRSRIDSADRLERQAVADSDRGRQLAIAGTPDAIASAKAARARAALARQTSASMRAEAGSVKAAEGHESAPAFERVVDAVQAQFGRQVVAYVDERSDAADGFTHDGVAFVNMARPEHSVHFTVFHELQHLVRQDAQRGDAQAQLATRMLDQVWSMIERSGKVKYATQYLFKQNIGGKQMTVEQALASPGLRDEMLSDFMGRRAEDRNFWGDLADKHPQQFGGFVSRWVASLTGLIDKLRGTATAASIKNIDSYIANLDRAKSVAQTVLRAWADANPQLARNQGVSVATEVGGVQQSARAGEPTDADSVAVNLSVATGSIPKLGELQTRANAGDREAGALLNRTAHKAISHLVSGIDGVRVQAQPGGGLFAGEMEPSLGVRMEFPPGARPAVLAAIARFGENYNQWQVHVRADTSELAGHVFEDGSYATPVRTIQLKAPMERGEIARVIEQSGLPGLTFNDNRLEAYFTGDPNDQQAIERFERGFDSVRAAAGENVSSARRAVARLWPYGRSFAGERTIGYDAIRGDVRPAPAQRNAITRDFAAEHFGADVEPAQQQSSITPEQRELQERIARSYEAMPLNDLANPLVRKAYDELATEVLAQFDGLPIKVEMYGEGAEPYANSQAMRDDVTNRSRLFIFATEAATFGPPGVTYDNHPLLGDSGRKDVNGKTMVFNDLLRAVHDYYAHTLSPTQFGPAGEEAAWVNHMRSTKSAMARWALTSETRGQNSWVNFRHEVADLPVSQRPFATQKVGLLPIKYAMTGQAGVDAPVRKLADSLTPEQRRGSAADSTAYSRRAADASGEKYAQPPSGSRSVIMSTAMIDSLRGLEVTLKLPSGLSEPVVVDAAEALEMYADRINLMRQLIGCLGT